jgi:hypothetical protein
MKSVLSTDGQQRQAKMPAGGATQALRLCRNPLSVPLRIECMRENQKTNSKIRKTDRNEYASAELFQ